MKVYVNELSVVLVSAVNICMLLHLYYCNSPRNGHGSSRIGWEILSPGQKTSEHGEEMVKVQSLCNTRWLTVHTPMSTAQRYPLDTRDTLSPSSINSSRPILQLRPRYKPSFPESLSRAGRTRNVLLKKQAKQNTWIQLFFLDKTGWNIL